MNLSTETVHSLQQEIMEQSSLHQMEPLGLQGLLVLQIISMEAPMPQIMKDQMNSCWSVHLEK